MNDNPSFWAVVPAAGSGARMGSDIPKQYLPLLDKTVLEHTLEKLLAVAAIERVVVALSADDQYWTELSLAHHSRILTVTGGATRADSVARALQVLSRYARDNDRVLVHDAARPCLTPEDIQSLMDNSDERGGILAAPVSDTLKRATGGQIAATVSRDELWAAMTPQLFPLRALREALAKAEAAGVAITDEASAMEHSGWHPCLVTGRRDNIKITHPEDLALARMIIAGQQEAGVCE